MLDVIKANNIQHVSLWYTDHDLIMRKIELLSVFFIENFANNKVAGIDTLEVSSLYFIDKFRDQNTLNIFCNSQSPCIRNAYLLVSRGIKQCIQDINLSIEFFILEGVNKNNNIHYNINHQINILAEIARYLRDIDITVIMYKELSDYKYMIQIQSNTFEKTADEIVIVRYVITQVLLLYGKKVCFTSKLIDTSYYQNQISGMQIQLNIKDNIDTIYHNIQNNFENILLMSNANLNSFYRLQQISKQVQYKELSCVQSKALTLLFVDNLCDPYLFLIVLFQSIKMSHQTCITKKRQEIHIMTYYEELLCKKHILSTIPPIILNKYIQTKITNLRTIQDTVYISNN